MHRLHHQYSDTDKDPHSPIRFGLWGVARGQLKSYQKILRELILNKKTTSAIVADIPFDVSVLNRKGLWPVPYLIHLSIGLAIGVLFNEWLVGMAYFLGMMSHPVQGWMVNSLAHRYGYQNFDTHDHSKNNVLVAWLIFGEGFQNNHHAHPERANFAVKKNEIDLGYGLCKMGSRLGLLKIS